MTGQGDIWDSEHRFWIDGVAHFQTHMHEAAVMVFPEPAGIMVGKAILAGLEQAPRWSHVAFEGQTSTSTDAATILAYHAVAQRDGEAPYRALCSSTYVQGKDGWVLISHQQTPV